MDDLNEKLAGILNDPESMERVRKMAENLFGEEPSKQSSNTETADFGSLPSGEELQAIMSIISQLKNQKSDQRTHLLTALKPYLSQHRQEKTDNAIKILKLLELLPLIKDSGLFKF